jgi:hypothetical protein
MIRRVHCKIDQCSRLETQKINTGFPSFTTASQSWRDREALATLLIHSALAPCLLAPSKVQASRSNPMATCMGPPESKLIKNKITRDPPIFFPSHGILSKRREALTREVPLKVTQGVNGSSTMARAFDSRSCASALEWVYNTYWLRVFLLYHTRRGQLQQLSTRTRRI